MVKWLGRDLKNNTSTLLLVVGFVAGFFLFFSGVFSSYKEQTADLEGDGVEEKIVLKNGSLKLLKSLKTIWETPESWEVDSFEIADSNNDGKLEINLSVWKKGNFGSSKPFWVKENDQNYRNHFFVFGFKNGKLLPIWQSSNLDNPNCEFAFGDVDKDKMQELVIIEGEYGKESKCRGKYYAIWKWNGWGFSNQWRSKEGKYKNLKVVNGSILVDK